MSEQVPTSDAPATASHAHRIRLVVPIIVMVVSALGIGATLFAAYQGSGAPPSGYVPGAGARPGGRPTDFPSGGPTAIPSDAPTATPSPGTNPGSGRQPGAGVPSDRPTGGIAGGFPGGQRPGGTFTGNRPTIVTQQGMTGWQIGVVAGCSGIFVGALVFLMIELASRQRSKTASQTTTAPPPQPAPPQPDQWPSPQAPDEQR